MWWQYLLVFLCTILFDIVPLPLPPAFTAIIFLQITYDLYLWPAIIIGVAGSIVGRYVLTLYISKVSGKIFTTAKNHDVQFLGEKMKQKGRKGQLFILLYSLMPLPTTPLFIAGGMAKLRPLFLIPPFIIGKFISDTAAVFLGKYVADNSEEIIHGMISWQSISGVVLGLAMIFALLFVEWKSLIIDKKLRIRFKILKSRHEDLNT